MKKKAIFIANWKMYVASLKEAKALVAGIKKKAGGAEVWVAAPAAFLPQLKGLKLGGQALSPFESGAHTGELSAAMLREAGASFSLVGHSERRSVESNDDVREQLLRAADEGLAAVLCVGERAQHQDGAHFSEIEEQLRSALRGLPRGAKLLVAYEPVWAIGKQAADAMQPEALEETVIFIRKVLADCLGRAQALKVPILYGGSVEAENAPALLQRGSIAGFLVGHASAELESFLNIIRVCKE